MSNLVFPTIPGVSFPTIKTPEWSTTRKQSVGGRVIRRQNWAYPRWNFELSFEVLSDLAASSAIGAQTYQELVALLCLIQQAGDTFLFSDPTDNTAVLQNLGTGNGSATQFVLTHTIGGFTEPVGQGLSAGLLVYLNGAVQNISTYSLVAPNILQFNTAPGSGVVVTASYSYYFICEFTEDTQEFQNFMEDLWSLGNLKFRSVKS